MEQELENLKKERKQKLLHFETLDGLLKKTQNENKEIIKQRDKAIMEVWTTNHSGANNKK